MLKRQDSAEPDPNAYGNVYDKGSILDHWDKDRLLNEWSWDNWVAIWKKIKLASYLIPYRTIKTTWIRDLKVN